MPYLEVLSFFINTARSKISLMEFAMFFFNPPLRKIIKRVVSFGRFRQIDCLFFVLTVMYSMIHDFSLDFKISKC